MSSDRLPSLNFSVPLVVMNYVKLLAIPPIHMVHDALLSSLVRKS